MTNFDLTCNKFMASDGSSAENAPTGNHSLEPTPYLRAVNVVQNHYQPQPKKTNFSSGIIVTVPTSKIAQKAAQILKSKRLEQLN